MDKFLRELKEHIFNTMPIRLLCFEVYGSRFRITLLERGGVYARLASTLPGIIPEEAFRPHRLLRGSVESEQEVVKRLVPKYSPYAILSHTWLRTASGEVTHSDWNNGRFNPKDLGYRKLVAFCKAAWRDYGFSFGWMDTVCINKESSSELDESIRSMYNWYSRAAVCITYLAETETLSNMHFDPWFTRGWTLQELLAPDVIKFYNHRFKRLVEHSANDKRDLNIARQVERATTISNDELNNILGAPISRRMQLAATREVTRAEDMAYSLMGIFDISVPIAYGEGASRAFYRLLQEILNSSKNALDIINWAGALSSSQYNSLILPSSPRHYMKRSSNSTLRLRRPIEPLTLTHLGLRIPVILMPELHTGHPTSQISQSRAIGDYNAIVNLPNPLGLDGGIPKTYNLLDERVSGTDGSRYNGSYQMTFAVFNFDKALSTNAFCVPKTCIAIGLRCHEVAGKVSTETFTEIIRTNEPIVFELKRSTVDETNSWCWFVKPGELAKHGMQMIALYL